MERYMRAILGLALVIMSLLAVVTRASSSETSGEGSGRPELANSATAPASVPARRVAHARVAPRKTPEKVRRVAAKPHPAVQQSQPPTSPRTVKAARSKPANARSLAAKSHPTFRQSNRKAAVAQRVGPATRTGTIRAAASPPASSGAYPGEHRIVIQVTQNDPALMNLALNNAQNLTKHYAEQGQLLRIEFVAYGPGLHMLRTDSSPVKDRIIGLAKQNPEIKFSGCGNTMSAQSKQENKEITLISEARVLPAGIARIVELQEQGWSYVRP
jgi:uncharacterized protein